MKQSYELQLEIDDMLGCPGKCPGCLLSSVERKEIKPDLSTKNLDIIYKKLSDYIATLSNLKKLNITYGIADHGLLPVNYLVEIYEKAANLIIDNKLANNKNAVFMTFSLIGKEKNVVAVLDQLCRAVEKTDVFGNVPLHPIVVLDPALLYNKSFSPGYLNNLALAINNFKIVDLAINLSSDAIEKITPKELFYFAKERGFDEVTINLVPTFDNLKYTYGNNQKMIDWLIGYDKLVEKYAHPTCSYRPVLKGVIDENFCKTFIKEDFNEMSQFELAKFGENQSTLLEHIEKTFEQTIKKSLQIDHLGNIFPKFEAVGDIAHNPRFDLPVMGNLLGNESIEHIIKKSRTKQVMFREMKYAECQKCEFQRACSMTGFHVFSHIVHNNPDKNFKVETRENGCTHIAYDLFAHYFEQIKKERADNEKTLNS